MIHNEETAEDSEPPLTAARMSNDGDIALADLMISASPFDAHSRVAIFGHKTLPLLLTLARRQCASAATVAASAPSLETNSVDVAWIAHLTTEAEVTEALSKATHGLNADGHVVLDATAFSAGRSLSRLLQSFHDVGLRISSLLPQDAHLIVVAGRAASRNTAVLQAA